VEKGGMFGEIHEFGDFRLDPQQRRLERLNGDPVAVTAKPFDALLHLVEHAGAPVSRKALIAAVWPNTVVEDNNLTQAISTLRSVLGKGYIVTLPGRGYQFVHEVHAAESSPAAPALIEYEGSGQSIGSVAGTVPSRTESRLPRRAAAFISIGLIVLIGGFLAYEFGDPGHESPVTPNATAVLPSDNRYPDGTSADNTGTVWQEIEVPSIAVLPFADMSAQGDQAYFSDGLAEEILNQLAQIDDLLVIARSSSFSFRGQDIDARAIGKALRVSHLLEGSVRKDGDRLRITAQLIATANGAHGWSQSYDRELDDVFAIQQEIAQAVADALSVSLGLGGATPARGPSGDLDLYDNYLRARALLNDATAPGLERAERLLRDVLARDPSYHPARAALVQAYALMLNMVPERSSEVIEALDTAVADAMSHAPNDWSTHFGLAYLHMLDREWVEADREFALAESLAPASRPEASWERGDLLLNLGRASETAQLLQANARIDPLQLDRSYALQMALTALGRTEEAEAEYRRSLDILGDHQAIEHLALMRVWRSDDDALIRSRFDRYLDAQIVRSQWLSEERDAFEDSEAARQIIRRAFDDSANQDNVRLMVIGFHAGRHGDSQLAIAAMRRTLVDMRGISVQALWYPDLVETRHLSAFKDLVRDLGLVDYWRGTGDWGDFCEPLGPDDFECF
jgi:TolB-like protein/DNA-binding winged helix-turn-helix (wHTH) protein